MEVGNRERSGHRVDMENEGGEYCWGDERWWTASEDEREPLQVREEREENKIGTSSVSNCKKKITLIKKTKT